MKEKKKMKIPERTQKSKNGLIEFCKYVNDYYHTKALSILEVGSWTGISAEIFSIYFKKVICVDMWKKIKNTITAKYDMEEVEKRFDKRIEKYKNIDKIKKSSMEAANMIRSVDIVYIDANHSYLSVKKDIQLWWSKVRYFIAGHDYWPGKFPGVIKAVNELLGKPNKVFPDTSWIIKK
jgi:hypothetical protein